MLGDEYLLFNCEMRCQALLCIFDHCLSEFHVKTANFIKTCLLVAGLGINIGARADDVPTPSTPATPAASEKKPEQHIMMDHSKVDPKAMSRMKDKTVRIHTAGDPPEPDATKAGEEHMMMDHSVGDTKSMSRMKDKTVPIHKQGEPMPDPANRPCVDHIMMDHSKADPKAMSRMKDKTIPIHKSGDCTPTSPTPSVTPP